MTETPAERRLRTWCRISLLLYAGTTVVFLAAPGLMFASINATGRALGLPDTPEPTEMFWLSLTISMMVMLCVCCAFVIRDVRRNVDFCVPIVFGKFSGAAVALAAFVLWRTYPAHITVVLTDVPLGIATLVLWRQAKAAASS